MMFLHVDYACADQCCNQENEMRMTCYKCGKCGRKFNNAGIMTDKGNTTCSEFEDGEEENV